MHHIGHFWMLHTRKTNRLLNPEDQVVFATRRIIMSRTNVTSFLRLGVGTCYIAEGCILSRRPEGACI